ncbi:MAG TPA: hypothetical protein P5567_06960 [Kiritimatiellia bacterium]|nr:hypothetical protein [Kiritimatiellia bacterium]HRZ12178.1 hypothetical protein [Kiritimatiellia bacterium]HSA18064.1 hypothetical protein [Kiritimatiellia bacterium]
MAGKQAKAHMLGVGLDHRDEHVRITRGPNFTVLMGSEETHESLRGACMKINEKLRRRGKRIETVSAEEFFDMVREAGGS